MHYYNIPDNRNKEEKKKQIIIYESNLSIFF